LELHAPVTEHWMKVRAMYAEEAKETFAAMQTQINTLKQGNQSKVSCLSYFKKKECRAALVGAAETLLSCYALLHQTSPESTHFCSQ
jgi:hypothetical protein